MNDFFRSYQDRHLRQQWPESWGRKGILGTSLRDSSDRQAGRSGGGISYVYYQALIGAKERIVWIFHPKVFRCNILFKWSCTIFCQHFKVCDFSRLPEPLLSLPRPSIPPSLWDKLWPSMEEGALYAQASAWTPLQDSIKQLLPASYGMTSLSFDILDFSIFKLLPMSLRRLLRKWMRPWINDTRTAPSYVFLPVVWCLSACPVPWGGPQLVQGWQGRPWGSHAWPDSGEWDQYGTQASETKNEVFSVWILSCKVWQLLHGSYSCYQGDHILTEFCMNRKSNRICMGIDDDLSNSPAWLIWSCSTGRLEPGWRSRRGWVGRTPGRGQGAMGKCGCQTSEEQWMLDFSFDDDTFWSEELRTSINWIWIHGTVSSSSNWALLFWFLS